MPVLNHGGLSVAFTCTKPDVWNKSNSTLVAKFANSTADPMYGLSFQCAVPKFVTMEMVPPTSTTVPAGVAARGGRGGVTQTVRITNTQLGKKNLMIKIRVGFTRGGE